MNFYEYLFKPNFKTKQMSNINDGKMSNEWNAKKGKIDCKNAFRYSSSNRKIVCSLRSDCGAWTIGRILPIVHRNAICMKCFKYQ